MLRQVEQMLAASQDEAVALSREIGRRRWLLEALRTVIEAGDDLAMAGYAVVPLEPTEAMIDAYMDAADAKRPMEDVCRERWRAMVAAVAEQDDPP